MVATNLDADTHESGERFNVRLLAAPLALHDSLGVCVATSVHAGVFIEGAALLVTGNRPFVFQPFTHDPDNVGIGDAQDAFTFGFAFRRGEGPLHTLAVVANMSGRQLGSFAAWTGASADTNLNRDGHRRFGDLR